ncbi:hypothetical protein BJ912DRAFT_1143719 [Pholiota molesta]|nr:hypothetical protein BJ912DRAFT_1143719 [Pholiota molesta]
MLMRYSLPTLTVRCPSTYTNDADVSGAFPYPVRMLIPPPSPGDHVPPHSSPTRTGLRDPAGCAGAPSPTSTSGQPHRLSGGACPTPSVSVLRFVLSTACLLGFPSRIMRLPLSDPAPVSAGRGVYQSLAHTAASGTRLPRCVTRIELRSVREPSRRETATDLVQRFADPELDDKDQGAPMTRTGSNSKWCAPRHLAGDA